MCYTVLVVLGFARLDLLCVGYFGCVLDRLVSLCGLFGVVCCRFLIAGLLLLVWWVDGFGLAF